MDIPALSMMMAQSEVRQDVSIGMLNKSLESAEEMSEGLTKIMEYPVSPDLGGSINILV